MRSRIKIPSTARGARGRRGRRPPHLPQARLPRWVRASVPSRLHPRAPRLSDLGVSASSLLPSFSECLSSVSPPFLELPLFLSVSVSVSASLPSPGLTPLAPASGSPARPLAWDWRPGS